MQLTAINKTDCDRSEVIWAHFQIAIIIWVFFEAFSFITFKAQGNIEGVQYKGTSGATQMHLSLTAKKFELSYHI